MRQPVSLSQGQSMCPGVQLPVSNTCSSSPISEKHLRTVPLGSHSALGWNNSTSCPDPYFNPNWHIVNPKPGHGSPVTQQLSWFHDWYPSMLAAPSEWHSLTLELVLQLCTATSNPALTPAVAGAPSTQYLSIQPYGTLLCCKFPAPHPAILLCLISGKQQPEEYVVKNVSYI